MSDAHDGETKAAAEVRIRAVAPAYDGLLDVVARHAKTFEFVPTTSGFELRGTSPVEGRPNRCRVKVFQRSADLAVAFFYKASIVPYSRNRYSYGLAMLPLKQPPADAAAWLDWIDCGFDPDRRPRGLKRAFAFTIPDD